MPREALSLIARAANAPVFGLFDSYMGSGIVGGPLTSFEGAGKTAADLALRVMAGESPGNIPFTSQGTYAYVYDWRELKRWGIKEKSLPPGSIVQYKEFSVWDLYRWYIIGGILFIILETIVVVFLVVVIKKLKRAEDKYRNIFEGSVEGIFETSPQGQPLTANPALAKILGYASPDEFTSSIRDAANQVWANPDERAENVRLLEKQDVVLGFECQFLRKDGTKIWVSVSSRRVCGPDGKTLFYSGFLEDISERKKAEAEAVGARTELLRVERSSRLGELVASLAHELNQPLAAILSSAQAALRFLQSATPDLNLFRTILQNIVEDDKRAAGVITSLRSMVKREKREKEPLNINEILRDVLTLFRAEAISRNVEIKTDFDSSLPPVSGDRVQLQQVVLNLVMNAAEAMSEKPRQQRRIILRTQATDHGIQAAVRDSGPGIDPEKLDDIWQSFFTTKSTGMGMGLSLSHSIIRGTRRAHLGRE